MVWGGLLGAKNMFFWLVLDASTEFRVDRFPVVTFSTSPQKVTVNPQPSQCWQSLTKCDKKQFTIAENSGNVSPALGKRFLLSL